MRREGRRSLAAATAAQGENREMTARGERRREKKRVRV